MKVPIYVNERLRLPQASMVNDEVLQNPLGMDKTFEVGYRMSLSV